MRTGDNPGGPRPFRAFPITASALLLCAATAFAVDLDSYVRTEDGSFAWKVESEIPIGGGGTAWNVRLTSQTWRGVVWRHWLSVLRPAEVRHPEHALLLVTGGSSRSKEPRVLSTEGLAMARIARETGSVVAVLGQVPNQPLFGDLYEDALISFTFEQFLKTRDATWPCLLPMTKSAVRAMDAVQALLERERSQKVGKFVVTGASKRGWTTWLTAAVDRRVVGIAPMVIDTLNMKEQMKLQKKSFGGYSEKIHDYSDRGLLDRLGKPEAAKLLDLVDPWSYRERLEMPKLLLLGTNDPYWPVDAVRLYFGGLGGEKAIHYEPNRGHGLGPGAVPVLAAFYHALLEKIPRPRLRWSSRREKDQAILEVGSTRPARRADLWHASSSTRDFRKAHWESAAMESIGERRFRGAVAMPRDGYRASFAQVTFESPLGVEWSLSTPVEVLGEGR